MSEGGGQDPGGLRAMVLAAGYGTRLAPLTDHLPKPLLPVDGEPLLDRIIARILAAGISPVAVNSHHLGGMVGAHLVAHRHAAQLVHFSEAEILGTGGALANAREFLDLAPYFLVHNGDVLCDVDLKQLLAAHVAGGARATLLLVDWPAVNSVTLGSDGAVRHIAGTGEAPLSRPDDRQLTYAGIGVFSRDLLADIGPGFSSLIDPLARAWRQEAGSVRGYAPADVAWDDLGTLARWLGVAGRNAQTSDGFALTRIVGHGSDRRFWRLGGAGWSTVAMQSPPADDEFSRFVAIGRFLAVARLGAPDLLSVDEPAHTVLMEDVGPVSLYAMATAPEVGADRLARSYGQVVDQLLALQAATVRARQECPAAVDRILDRVQLRGETTYFQERFLQGYLGWTAERCAGLAAECDHLAATTAAQPLTLIHRDFQSQNILLQADQVRLVDFQGLRLGPLTYDLSSLVWDPYVGLPAALRRELGTRFAVAKEHTPDAIAAMIVATGLQRVMQALGAFGFLGHARGKREFLRHIPAGVRYLRLLLAELAERQGAEHLPPAMPNLTRLAAEIPPAEPDLQTGETNV